MFAEDHLEPRAIPDDGAFSLQPNGDLLRLPLQIVDMSGRDRAQILVLRERHSYWRYQLKLRGVQASRGLDIGVHQRTKPASFNLLRKRRFERHALGIEGCRATPIVGVEFQYR